jgi:hypothetical protein
VAAHAKITDVVKEDHPCGGCRIYRRSEQGADEYIRTPWLVADSSPKIFVIRL